MKIECPSCGSEDLEGAGKLDDGRLKVRCQSCGNEWVRGEAKPIYKAVTDIQDLRKRFPSTAEIDHGVRSRVEDLKREFLEAQPSPDPRAIEFRERYRQIFSRDGLAVADPEDFKYFANANLSGNPGNMSVFNNAWNEMGPDEGAAKVRESIEYLLYGPENTFIEDRLTNLIEARRGLGMTGFREALLTKVLCMVEPTRFLPINKYTGNAGKREIAKWVYGLSLPAPESVSWTIGRLIFWSNELLLEAVGTGFTDCEHIAGFLWWAKDEMRASAGQPRTGDVDAEPDYVIFKDDDDGFRAWMQEHPGGLYINAARSPKSDELLLHRVGCDHVGDAPKGTSWTKDYIKICAMSEVELQAWARAETGGDARHCQSCVP